MRNLFFQLGIIKTVQVEDCFVLQPANRCTFLRFWGKFSKKRRKLGQNEEKTQATERLKGKILDLQWAITKFKRKKITG